LPVLNDLILDNLPYFRTGIVFDISVTLITIIFIIYAFKHRLNHVSYYLLIFGFLYTIRSFFIIITPFGNPSSLEDFNGFYRGKLFDKGVFPSGHTGSGFMAFLLSSGVYKKIIFLLLIITVIFLFFGRGHYSFDILAAILFSYALYSFCEKYLKNKFVLR